MAERYLTFKKKNTILDRNGTTILQTITVSPMFMCELVEAEVLDGYQSTDIQALKVPGQMCEALKVHLQSASEEAFCDFCIVLVDKQRRQDIIKEFGLDINQIRSQKRQMEEETHQPSNGQEAQAVAAASGGTKALPLWDEDNEDCQDMLKRTDLYETHVKKNYDAFVADVCLDNLLPKMIRLKIVNKLNQDRVMAETTSYDKVFKLMEILETSPVWRFQALLRALHEDEQGPCITLLGLKPATYKDVKKA